MEVELSNVTKTIKKQEILRGINFKLAIRKYLWITWQKRCRKERAVEIDLWNRHADRGRNKN